MEGLSAVLPLAALTIAAGPASPMTQAASAQEISVLTYNVKGLPWPVAAGRRDALLSIGEDLAAMRARGQQPNVVLIQEGFRGEVEALRARSGYRHWAQGPRRGWRKLAGGGLHVLSDLPIEAAVSQAFRACAGHDCLAAKGVMLATMRLPDGSRLAMVNTHLNARRASGAPPDVAHRAHIRQQDEIRAFLKRHRPADAAVVIGGDFNVKNAPARYGYRAETRPYTVVSEVCRAELGCMPVEAGPAPWLKSQDLQAFISTVDMRVQPLATSMAFDGVQGRRLSDHDGYLVRYRLTRAGRRGDAPLALAALVAPLHGPDAEP
jgi:endonuclease/exonuclease/phosphatase family metal-dependent hydrolase